MCGVCIPEQSNMSSYNIQIKVGISTYHRGVKGQTISKNRINKIIINSTRDNQQLLFKASQFESDLALKTAPKTKQEKKIHNYKPVRTLP